MSRLDPYTCEAIANMLTRREREALSDGSLSHLGGYAPRAAAWVRLFADAESASRPPTLSDWVRACEVSKFGAPQWHGREWDDTGWLVAVWDGRREKVLLCVDGSAARDATITTDPRNPGRDANSADYATPAALAALDALAAA